MNKKDVLVVRPAAWNVQKMESTPHGLSAGNAHFPALIPRNSLWIVLDDSIGSEYSYFSAGFIVLILTGN